MTNKSRAAFESWWEDFKSEHDEWQYADSDALRFAAWQASRKVALDQADAACVIIADPRATPYSDGYNRGAIDCTRAIGNLK